VRRPVIVSGDRAQARIFWLRCRWRCCAPGPRLPRLPEALERLGVATLGELAALSAAALADRFGKAGLLAHELACGGRWGAPTQTGERDGHCESLELPEAGSVHPARARAGPADRSRTRAQRAAGDGRSVRLRSRRRWSRAVGPGAIRWCLVEGGRPVRLRLALAPRLALLPAPAEELRLAVERFGPPASDQRGMFDDPAEARRARLREAIRQTGPPQARTPPCGCSRLILIPASRSCRAVLTPFERLGG